MDVTQRIQWKSKISKDITINPWVSLGTQVLHTSQDALHYFRHCRKYFTTVEYTSIIRIAFSKHPLLDYSDTGYTGPCTVAWNTYDHAQIAIIQAWAHNIFYFQDRKKI